MKLEEHHHLNERKTEEKSLPLPRIERESRVPKKLLVPPPSFYQIGELVGALPIAGLKLKCVPDNATVFPSTNCTSTSSLKTQNLRNCHPFKVEVRWQIMLSQSIPCRTADSLPLIFVRSSWRTSLMTCPRVQRGIAFALPSPRHNNNLLFRSAPRQSSPNHRAEIQLRTRNRLMKCFVTKNQEEYFWDLLTSEDMRKRNRSLTWIATISCGALWLSSAQMAFSSEGIRDNMVYEVSELFELGIQLTYLLLLLGLLGFGTFYVIRQVLVRRELDLSAKELQEQVRSGDASATELFELGAVMLRRKFYPAATKYLLQAIEKWDGDDQDLAQVYNALGVTYVRDEKLDKGIIQFEKAVKLQPGYVTAWNNLGDAYEKKKDFKSALKAFEEVLLFDPNNKMARPRRDALRESVKLYKGVPVKSKKR
ncbi:hypothetical protein Syun_012255 [Stephania yunnanensis]|uniref:Ycf37 n=1 Tax=Stephania yunnanensis TaxID=152371 RepID=A0AAP0PIU9_9MAGN